MLDFSTELRVRYAETDRMDVVYHSNYFVWFETARIHLLDHINLPYKDLEAQGLEVRWKNLACFIFKVCCQFVEVIKMNL